MGLIFMVTWLALYANLSVLMVSSMFFEEGDMFPMIKVFVLMVRDYCRSRVSFDSLKAATLDFFPLESEYITLPKVVKDKFMFLSYCK